MRKKAKFLKFLIFTIFLCITTSTAFADTTGELIEQWAAYASASSEIYTGHNAAGAPDYTSVSDSNNWTPDRTGMQWLRLVYNQPVKPTKIKIFVAKYKGKKYISKIYFMTVSGEKILAWEGDDSNIDCDWLDIPSQNFTSEAQNLTEPVDELIIYVNNTQQTKWYGIDAVKLIGYKRNLNGIRQWANDVYALNDDCNDYGCLYYAKSTPNVNNSYYDGWMPEWAEPAWIKLYYEKFVIPNKIRIYGSTINNNCNLKLYFITPTGKKILAWQGKYGQESTNEGVSNKHFNNLILELYKDDFTSEAKNLSEPINEIVIYERPYTGGQFPDRNRVSISAVELIGEERENPITYNSNISSISPTVTIISPDNIYYEGKSPEQINLNISFNQDLTSKYARQWVNSATATAHSSQAQYVIGEPGNDGWQIAINSWLNLNYKEPVKPLFIRIYEKSPYTGWGIGSLRVYFKTINGQKVLAWRGNNLYNDASKERKIEISKDEFKSEAKNLTEPITQILLNITDCYGNSKITAVELIGEIVPFDKGTVNLKKGDQTLLTQEFNLDPDQPNVEISIPDEIKNQIAYNPGIYTVEAIVGSGDNKKVVTKNFTVKAVTPHLALEGPDTVNILESSSVNINVNASVNPAESGYTLSQITYSIPELNITDQPVENGSITINNIDHPVAEVYHVTVKGCINELEDRCTEESKNIRFTAPTPEIELSCPSSIYQGQNMTCQLNLTTQDYTPEQLQIGWMIDGQEQENSTDTTSLDYTFNDTGNHYIKAVAKFKNAPFIQAEKTARINVISTQIDISSLTCGFVSDWSNFWTQEHICPFDTAGDNGEIKLNVIANFNDLTPKIKIVDADTGDVLKDVAIENTNFEIKPEDVNFAHILQTKNLNIIAYYEEMPDKKVEKNISVISAPSIPEFDVTIDDSKVGQAPVQVAIKNYNPDIYGPNSNWKAGLTTLLSGQIDTVDYTVFNISGKASLNYSYNKEGQLNITPKVALFYNGNPIKVFNLSSQTITAKLAKPIRMVLRSSENWKGFAPFTTTVVAYSSYSTWHRTKGLEWILDNQTIAGGPDEVVKHVNLTIEEPGNHTLLIKGYHTDSEQIDNAGNATFEILSTPEDVKNAFELKVYYNRDKTITVATGRIYKANELVTTPVRERLQTFDWKIKDSSGNIVKSGQSNITRWNIDFSDLDLNKNYSIEVDWHTSIGRNFIAEADVDESMIKTHGIDFSKADLRVFKLNSRRHDVYLGGISSTLMKITNMQTHFEIYDLNGNKITEGNTNKISFDPSQIEGTEYTAKCNVKNPDGEVVWQKTLNVALDNTTSLSKSNNNQNNSGTSNNTDDSDIVQLFANRIGLSCMVMDPFAKRVRCVVDKIYYGLFLKRHGYTVNYCVSTPDSDEICGKSIIYYTFETGGEKTVTLNFTYSKNDQSQTITRNATVVLPSSLEELLSDPEKGLYGDVKIVDPVHNKIKAEANIKDRYYRNAFFRLYTLHLKLVDNNGNTIFEPKLGRTTFYYEMPPSETDSYTLKIDVVSKNDPQNVVYSTDTNFNIETLTQNMADLKIEPMNGRNTPWGVYMFTVNINPTSLVRYLGWDMILKNEQNENISELKRFSRKVLKLPEPGSYTIEFKAYSKDNPDNVFLTKTYTIEATNEKPQVNINKLDTLVDYRGRHILLVDITPVDSDGRIKSINISACNSTKRYTRSIFNCGDNESADVNIKVCDDAGECTEITRHVQWDLTSANN